MDGEGKGRGGGATMKVIVALIRKLDRGGRDRQSRGDGDGVRRGRGGSVATRALATAA